MSKIVIDARFYNESGIGRYIRGLVLNLQKIDKENEYFILLGKKDYGVIEFKDNFHKVLADFPWYGVSEQIKMPKLLISIKPDLTHFPHFNVPIFYGGKFVVTIHDLIHQHFKMKRASTHNSFFYRFKQFGYNNVFKAAVSRSENVLVPSEYVKSLLSKNWQVSDEKIKVTKEAAEHKLINISKHMTKEKSLKIVESLGIKGPYLFYIGNAHPHKNVEALIGVFLKLQEKYNQLYLVLSGQDHYFWQRTKEENARNPKIIFTGFVTDEQAVALYKNAVCFIMPSLEEGFGIPLLEAFACSCPVVSSNAGSLPEVGGDAAIYFDPKNSAEMETQINQVLTSEKLRQELIKKGLERYKEFSWEKLAKETLEVYLKCV